MSYKRRAEQHVKLFIWRFLCLFALAFILSFAVGVPVEDVTTATMTDTRNETAPSEVAGAALVTSTTNSSQNPTTLFADDSVGYEASLAYLDQRDPFSSLVIAPSSQTIIDFLQRPSIITSGALTASDSGILWITDVTTLITSQKVPRMSNIYTWRADFEVTLQVNADRFQQGRYILFFLPTGGALGPTITGNTLQWRNMHTCNLMKITQLPHVEIDLATQTHVTLKIPYTSVNPMSAWLTLISASQFGLGLVGLIPYSALNPGGGGSTTCGYTILGSLTNIKLGAGTYNQADEGTLEARAQGQGPITSFLNRVSLSSGVFSDVPLIGSYARSVSWFSKVAAKAASVWGYSKPLAVAAPMRMDRKTTPFNAVSDVIHMAKPLSMSAENSVSYPSSIPVGVDEMDLNYIVGHYAYLQTNSWSTGDVAGTKLVSLTVSPQGYTTWSKGYVYTPLCFVGNQFWRWRGGIKYRFKLVKTGFHRGRLAVAYYPSSAGTGGSLAQSEFVFREIVDLNLSSEFEVCCPYMLPFPWRQQNAPMGVLDIYVVDPLVAPTTVSTTVVIITEVAGAEDMQFSAPTNWQVEPYCPSTAQSGEEAYTSTPCFTLGPPIRKPAFRLNAETSGEVVRSVRQILKRNYHIGSSQNAIGQAAYAQVFPYALSPVTQAATTSGALSRDKFYADPITLWSFAFVFTYGSIRYVFRPNGTVQKYVLETQAIPGGSTLTQWYSSATGYLPSGFSTYSGMDIEGPVEIQAPNWNSGIGRAVPAHIINTQAGTGMMEPAANCTNILIGDSLATAGYTFGVARAAGEDFGLGFFIGVPPVVLTSAT